MPMHISPEKLPDSTPLLKLTNRDTFTLGDSYEGIQIVGATGSGKTSGSGAAIRSQMLRRGFGGLVLTVKTDEPGSWCDPANGYLAQTNRLEDLIVLQEGGDQYFDFLQYESQCGSDTLELSRLFTTVLESAGRGGVGGSDGGYWATALNQLITNAVDLSRFATKDVSLYALSQIVQLAPISIDATREWEWERFVDAAKSNAITDEEKRDLDTTLDYFNLEFPRLGDRLRSSITNLFTSMANDLRRGTIGTLFSGRKVTFTPEDTHRGKIIVLNLPTHRHGETGRFAQMIFKYIWQRAAERRDRTQPMRPVFLWCDESQELITSRDAGFQATARSSKVATVYLTQNIRYYHSRLGGGAKAEADTDSLLGNLNTKILHANGDTTTNAWAEKTFGLEWVEKINVSPGGESKSLATESRVMASLFTTLKKGKAHNRCLVGSFMFMAGQRWKATDCNAIYVEFAQTPEAEAHRNLSGVLDEKPSPGLTATQVLLGVAVGVVILAGILWRIHTS